MFKIPAFDDSARITGEKVVLRTVVPSDCTSRYVSWLNDPEVNGYLETRWARQSEEAVREFVLEQRQRSDVLFLAILDKASLDHVGNIKVGPVHAYHRFAEVSYFIGEKEFWGRGFASEAIQLVTRFAFEELRLVKLQAGVHSENVASCAALRRAGYVLEGSLKGKLAGESRRADHLWFGAYNMFVYGV